MSLLSRIRDQVNPFDGGKTYKNPNPKPKVNPYSRNQYSTPAKQNIVQRGALGLSLGGLRSFTGLGQGLSGLYDLASPGTGTNRFSKQLETLAKNTDATAKAERINTGMYKGSQAATDLLTLGAGTLLKGGQVATKISQGNKAVETAMKARTAGLAGGNFGSRVAARGINNLAKPGYQATNAAYTALYAGKDASQGRQITPQRVATDLAIGGVGFPAAGGLGRETLSTVGKKLPAALKPQKAPQGLLNKREKAVIGFNAATDKGKKVAAQSYDKEIKGIDKQISKAKRPAILQRKPLNEAGTAEVGGPILPVPKLPLKQKSAPKAPAPVQSLPDSSPNTNLVDELVKAQKAQEDRIMKYSGVEKVRSKGRNVSQKFYNPYAEAERFNQKLAKAQNIPLKKLPATQDLAHNLDVAANSGVAAQKSAIDSGLQEVVGRYKPGTPDENQFITYLAAKRDLNVRANKGKKILPFEEKDINDFIKQYERSNPRATADLATVNKHFEGLAKSAQGSGTITDDALKAALQTEDFYAPVSRVSGSEDLLRPTINANSLGSLSKQTALQKLTGSNKPLNVTWDAIVNSTTQVTRENAKNRAFNVLYDAADKNLVDDMVRMGISKEQSKSLLDLRDTITQLESAGKGLRKELKGAGREARKSGKQATAFNNKQQAKAIERIAKSMEAVDPDGAAAIRGLGKRDQAHLTRWISDGMTEAQINRGNRLNQKAQDAYAKVMDLRAQAENLHGTTMQTKGEARGLQIIKDDKTGRQVINGFVDGYPVWLETTPESAKMIQGLEPKELGAFIKGLSEVQHVWRTFWTGLFNPYFAIKSKLFYDPAMMVLNQSGSRNQLRPKAWGSALGDNFTDVNKFFDSLKPYGVSPVTGSRIMGDTKQTAELMASHANFQSRLAYLAKHPTEALQALDIFGGKLAHSSRMQAARAEYLKAKAAKLPEDVAKSNAARAYNNVLPNYGRTTKALRTLDAFIPYSNAGVAGTRAMTTAARTDAKGFAAKAGAFAAALGAAGSYALTDEATQAFYQDMYDTNKQSILQNNIVFALPGAHKDPETGEWVGIVKVPIPPEFRAPNAIIQDQIFKKKGGDANGYNPTTGAISTGVSGGILNVGRGGGPNAELNPGITAATELISNKRNLGTGDPYAYGDTQFLPRNEQINKDTSQFAIKSAQAFNKLPIGDISPAALDSQLKGFGPAGKVVRSVGSKLTADANTPKDRLPGTDIIKSGKGIVSADGTKGMTEATWHFKNQDKIRETLKTKTSRDQFDLLNSKSDSPGDAGQKASLLFESLQTDGTLWSAQKTQNDMDAQVTGLSNPLFGLSPEQARAVVLYRSNARMNAAKQTYAKDGTSLFQALGLDEPWYQEFKKQESAFYDTVAAKSKGDKETDSNIVAAAKTYSGKGYEEASPVIESKLKQYYALPKGTGARSAFLAANPDVIQYWDKQNGLANEERIAMGLKPLSSDQFGGGSGYGGSSGGGYSSSIADLSSLNKRVANSKVKAVSLKSSVKKPGATKIQKPRKI